MLEFRGCVVLYIPLIWGVVLFELASVCRCYAIRGRGGYQMKFSVQ